MIATHLLVLFIILFNVLDQLSIHRLRLSPEPRARLRTYRLIMGWLWAATIAAVWIFGAGRLWYLPIDRSQERWMPGPITTGIVLVASLIALVGPLLALRKKPSAAPNVARALDKLRFFLPHTAEERLWWAFLSITAGICEETLFRSFLLLYLRSDPWRLGPGVAILVACVLFALGHLYQGVLPAVGTGVLALLFFVLFLGSGNLLLSMTLHAITDLRILLLLRLSEPAQT